MHVNVKKYGKSILIRAVISVSLLLFAIIVINIYPINNILLTNFNKQINIINPIIDIKNIISNNKNNIDKPVNVDNIYDSITYDGKINHITNYDFNGVKTINEGLIIRIDKKENNLFDVFVQNENSYIYVYRNLESVDFNIYTYLNSQTILGAATYDITSNTYKFDIEIIKEQVRYSLNDVF